MLENKGKVFEELGVENDEVKETDDEFELPESNVLRKQIQAQAEKNRIKKIGTSLFDRLHQGIAIARSIYQLFFKMIF